MLGVGPDADPAEIRRAYLSLARRHHPDRSGGDVARMRAVNEAWATLGDPLRRREYDLARGHLGWSASATHRAWAASAEGPPDVPEVFDEDDRPLRVTVAVPRWLTLLPAGLFAASLGAGMVGVLVALPAFLGLALMLFVLSTLLFLASPFIALYASRRPTGGGAGSTDG